MSGVRSQLVPLQGLLSTRSLAPAASTLGWLASTAKAGSFDPLGRYGVTGLPTDTLASGLAAEDKARTTRAAVNPIRQAIAIRRGLNTKGSFRHGHPAPLSHSRLRLLAPRAQ